MISNSKTSHQSVWDDISASWPDDTQKLYESLSADVQIEAERVRLSSILKERMHEVGMTQRKLAEKMHMQPSEVSRLLNGKSNATWSTQVRMATELGLRINFELVEPGNLS
jgi:predicted XRE-type DNA-binding protein